jgi:16S rRNA (adenine1518-N6/adenine1519-N6)-dimethyltransferase
VTPAFPRARKRFGQHFLEPAWIARLLEALSPRPDDTFLEIGPGRGALTLPLAGRVHRVIAVEIDRDLVALLRERIPGNVEVVECDFLNLDVAGLLGDARPVRVVGNLPYNVASPILFRLLEAAEGGRVLQDATVMLQREVADRVVAAPGTGAYGALAVQLQLQADVSRLMNLPPGAFRPPPKVHSSVIQLRFRPPQVEVGDVKAFERLVRGLFLQRRKTVANALKPVAHAAGREAADVLSRAALDGRRRPETLSLDEIARLSRAML